MSAGLDAIGVIPIIGEIADGAKTVDKVSDVAKAVDRIADTSKGVKKTSKSSFAGLPKKIHSGRQGKHVVGHNNYKKGRSVFLGSTDDAQKLIKKYSGTGQKINSTSERVNFKKVIGKYVDELTGKAYDTTVGTIRYSKDGAHIVPARPLNWRK